MLKDALAQHNTHLTIDTHTNTHTAIHTTASLVYSSHPLHTPHPKLSSEFPSVPKIDSWEGGRGLEGGSPLCCRREVVSGIGLSCSGIIVPGFEKRKKKVREFERGKKRIPLLSAVDFSIPTLQTIFLSIPPFVLVKQTGCFFGYMRLLLVLYLRGSEER